MITAQDIIRGKAHEALCYRIFLESKVIIFVDVLVKHAIPLGKQTVWEATEEIVDLEKADALIITGPRTGKEVNMNNIRMVKSSLKTVPIIAGSGVDSSNIRDILEYADGIIVETSFKEKRVTRNQMDSSRVRKFMDIVERL